MAEPYILNWDLSHLGDDSHDARLIKFPGWENIVRLASTKEYSLPDKIVFSANLRTLESIDFPYNDVNWPIMSKKMLDVLVAVRKFPHRAIPIIMLDDVVTFDDQGDAKHSGDENHEFVAVQILEHANVIDLESSIYEVDEDFPGRIDNVEKLVLKEPREGFYPLFRLAGYPIPLLTSQSARLALEGAGIQGVVFESLANFP